MTPVQSPPFAREAIQRIATVVARHHPSVMTLLVQDHTEGVSLCWSQSQQDWTLLFEPLHDGACLTKTGSCCVSVRTTGSFERLPDGVDQFVQTVVALTKRKDAGDWTFPHVTTKKRVRSPWDGRQGQAATEAHQRLSEPLHFASYVAYRAVTSTDLYPHIVPLGDPVEGSDLLASWSHTLAQKRAGHGAPKLGLYIHIPYCTVACTFCFCGKTDQFKKADFDAYLSRLEDEITFFSETFRGAKFSSVYFGGGTPSLLTPPALTRLFDRLYGVFDVTEAEQVVFEGNPDSLTTRKIEILATLGRVTRLTVGVQTLDDEAQRRAKRFNTHAHVSAAVAAAREWGIPHINIDLMAGMDGQSVASFQEDVHFVLGLQPDSMNLNGFRPVPRTAWFDAGNKMSDQQMNDREEMLSWGHEQLSTAGLVAQRGVDPGRTRNAANVQEYNLRRQNSSLLGLGFPAQSHAFGQWFYEADARGGFDEALGRQNQTGRRWMGVPVDVEEEKYKFWVDNLVTGFDSAEFETLFGCGPWTLEGQGLSDLAALGVVREDGDWVQTDPGNHVDGLIYRVFLYGPAVWQRLQRRWAPDYDKSVDYREKLDRLIARRG
jgi:oxygen-independent coproporphyrinogen-3 oxidase